MNKKLFALSIGSFLVLALVVGFGSLRRASADNGREQSNGGGDGGNGIGQTARTLANSNGQDNTENAASMQESAKLGPNGNFTLTGATVVSVDTTGNSITATLYGITKTVSVAGATITGGNSGITLSSIQAGDKVSATGQYNESTHTAVVSTVNDTSYAQQNTSNVQSRINQLLQLVQQLQAQLQAMQGKP